MKPQWPTYCIISLAPPFISCLQKNAQRNNRQTTSLLVSDYSVYSNTSTYLETERQWQVVPSDKTDGYVDSSLQRFFYFSKHLVTEEKKKKT